MSEPRRDGLSYALVSGHGRSGTNWLLELLDLSPQTFCRSEPSGIETSPLAKLGYDRFVHRANQSALAEHWDDAVRWAIRHMGERDRRVTMPKRHIYRLSRALGLYRMVRGPRYRRALSIVLPSLRGKEWIPPWFVFDRKKLDEALPVLKLVSSPGWSEYVLRHRPHVPHLHIVRHPGGYLNSWANRYRVRMDEREIQRQNERRLNDIASEHPIWAERFGDISAMTTDESELWFWCYATETIDAAGCGKAAYCRIVYEKLASEPVPMMKRIYELCGLDWSEKVERAVIAVAQDSPSIAANWRAQLTDEQLDAVERILTQSSVRNLWTDEAVARHDFRSQRRTSGCHDPNPGS